MTHAARLFDRLRETASAPLSREAFFRDCYRRKRDPDQQFADDRIYALATTTARRSGATNERPDNDGRT